MAGYKHFSHPHMLYLDEKASLEGGPFTCSGCNFPCIDTTIYSCLACKFFLHEQCFNATRSMIHPLHLQHPLSLSPSPTYPSGSFICNLCNESGSGFCFCCSICDFDLHIQCAYYNNHNPKPETIFPPYMAQVKAHPNHPLCYKAKSNRRSCHCDLCGMDCDPNGPLYRCDICDFDTHLECVHLQEIIKVEDHEHELSLCPVNLFQSSTCVVCRSSLVKKKHCMYSCKSGCDYGIHVKCVSAKVSKQTPVVLFRGSELSN